MPFRGAEHVPWVYDPFMRLFEAAGLGRWRLWLVAGARGRVLDVGCGTGRNLPLYGLNAAPVVGVDVSMEVLRSARKKAPRATLLLASVEALPFKDGSFHTVVSGLCFCSVPDPARGLAEVRRVLAPGGALRMLEHVRSTNSFWAWVQDRLAPAWRWFTGGCHIGRDTEKSVEQAGFRIERDTRRAQGTLRRFQARPR